MVKEERYIRNKFGRENKFRVPEGYFDSFATRLMDKLPEREACEIPVRRPLLARLRPLFYAAACLCVAIFSVAVYLARVESSDDGQGGGMAAVYTQSGAYGDNYEDEALDYAMLDNTDIYAYLSSGEQ